MCCKRIYKIWKKLKKSQKNEFFLYIMFIISIVLSIFGNMLEPFKASTGTATGTLTESEKDQRAARAAAQRADKLDFIISKATQTETFETTKVLGARVDNLDYEQKTDILNLKVLAKSVSLHEHYTRNAMNSLTSLLSEWSQIYCRSEEHSITAYRFYRDQNIVATNILSKLYVMQKAAAHAFRINRDNKRTDALAARLKDPVFAAKLAAKAAKRDLYLATEATKPSRAQPSK
jgi:hypothetical protein